MAIAQWSERIGTVSVKAGFKPVTVKVKWSATISADGKQLINHTPQIVVFTEDNDTYRELGKAFITIDKSRVHELIDLLDVADLRIKEVLGG